MQRSRSTRSDWIEYAAFDAKGTWLLHSALSERLSRLPWKGGKSLLEFYERYMVDFGKCLTDMERRGVRVNTDWLADIEVRAKGDQIKHIEVFRRWAEKMIGNGDGLAINPSSSQQLQTFLFGGSTNQKTGETIERVRKFKVPRSEVSSDALEVYKQIQEAEAARRGEDGEEDALDKMSAVQLKQVLKENKLKQVS